MNFKPHRGECHSTRMILGTRYCECHPLNATECHKANARSSVQMPHEVSIDAEQFAWISRVPKEWRENTEENVERIPKQKCARHMVQIVRSLGRSSDSSDDSLAIQNDPFKMISLAISGAVHGIP